MTKQQEDEIIDNMVIALGTYNLGDIKNTRKIAQEPFKINMMLATFILCSCFLDQMAQIRYFDKAKWKSKRPYLTNNFKKFVSNYLNPKYQPKLLYDSLRSRLVHNYSVRGKYWLADNKKYNHLQYVQGRIFLNIDDFIIDIEIAWEKLKKDLLTDPITRQNAVEHNLVYPILKQNNI